MSLKIKALISIIVLCIVSFSTFYVVDLYNQNKSKASEIEQLQKSNKELLSVIDLNAKVFEEKQKQLQKNIEDLQTQQASAASIEVKKEEEIKAVITTNHKKYNDKELKEIITIQLNEALGVEWRTALF